MHHEGGFNWIAKIPGLEHFPNHLVMASIVAVLLILTTWLARAQLLQVMRQSEGGVVPEPHMTYRNFFEIIAEKLYGLVKDVMGEHEAAIHYPMIGTLFLFVFVSNLCGLVPGLLPPTDNLNTTLALGAFVFVYYNYAGVKANGWSYLKHFLGPVLWLSPLLLVIELVSHLVRPISLALRLRGNIVGDHIVLGIFNDLVPILVPIIFYGLGVFVSFIQAFVFCLMTMVYISMSTAHDH